MSITAIVAGLVFLFNPHVNIIDIMPDAMGYGLILYGIIRLAHINTAMNEAASRFKTLFILALCKLPCLYIYALISPEEQVWILLLSLGFGAAEAIIGFLAFTSLFTSLEGLSDSSRDTHVSEKLSSVRLFTLIFVILKPVMAILPDLTMLADDRYGTVTENGIQSLKGYRGLFNVIAFVFVLFVGIAWLVTVIRYFRSIRKDRAFLDEISDKIASYEREDTVRYFRYLITTLTFFIYAVFFCLELKIEGYSLLPPMINATLFLITAVLFFRFYKNGEKKKTVTVGLIASISYFVLSLVGYVLMLRFAQRHYNEDVGGGFAEDLYFLVSRDFDVFDELLVANIVVALAQVAFFVMLFTFYRLFKDLIEAYGGNPESALSERDKTPEMREREQYADRMVKNALYKGQRPTFVFTALTTVSAAIFPLLQIYFNEFFMIDLVLRVIFVTVASSYLVRLKNGIKVKAGLDFE